MNWDTIISNSLRAFFGTEAVYYALAAIGLNLHFGYTGLLNFGQAGFMAAGAYGIGITVVTLNLPFLVGVPVGFLLTIGLALLLGVPTLRLRTDYLAIATIAAAEIVRLVVSSTSTRGVTGGSAGIPGVAGGFRALNPFSSGFTLGPISYSLADTWALTVGWGLVILASLLVFVLMRSPWGRVIKSIREDEDAARSLGKNVYAYKMQSLVLGGIMGALAGMLITLANGTVQPINFQTIATFFAYTALIMGGPARILGPVVGSMLFFGLLVFLENLLSQAVRAGVVTVIDRNQVSLFRFVFLGLALTLLMIFRPQGIFGDRKELLLDAR